MVIPSGLRGLSNEPYYWGPSKWSRVVGAPLEYRSSPPLQSILNKYAPRRPSFITPHQRASSSHGVINYSSGDTRASTGVTNYSSYGDTRASTGVSNYSSSGVTRASSGDVTNYSESSNHLKKLREKMLGMMCTAGSIVKRTEDGQFQVMITPHVIMHLKHRHYHHHFYHHHFRDHKNFHSGANKTSKMPINATVSNPNTAVYNANTAVSNPLYENMYEALTIHQPSLGINPRIEETIAKRYQNQSRMLRGAKSKNGIKRLYSNPSQRFFRRNSRESSSRNNYKIKQHYWMWQYLVLEHVHSDLNKKKELIISYETISNMKECDNNVIYLLNYCLVMKKM